jgi:putative intracellular protease/amidase
MAGKSIVNNFGNRKSYFEVFKKKLKTMKLRASNTTHGARMSLKDPNVLNPNAKKRVALVIANPAVSTTTGWPVGFWWSELTHPFHVFSEAGYSVELFSPMGGKCEADGMSDPNDASGYSKTDLISQGFIHTPELHALVDQTKPVAALDVDAFDAIVVAGGQAPMFNFAEATDLHAKFAEFHAAGKVAAALCHGTAVLAYAKDSKGEYIAKGKTVTGFANVEEDFADNAVWSYGLLPRDKHVMPWRIEDRLREIGANFVQAGMWRSFAVRDGNLITGQQNFSGEETARLVVEALGR